MAHQHFQLIEMNDANKQMCQQIMYKMQYLTDDAPLIYYLCAFDQSFFIYHALLDELDPVVHRTYQPLRPEEIYLIEFNTISQLLSRSDQFIKAFAERVATIDSEDCVRMQRIMNDEQPMTLATLHEAMGTFNPCCGFVRQGLLSYLKDRLPISFFRRLLERKPNFCCTWTQLECGVRRDHWYQWAPLWMWDHCRAERALLRRLADRPNPRQRVARLLAGMIQRARGPPDQGYQENGFAAFCLFHLSETRSMNSVTTMAVVYFLCKEVQHGQLFRLEEANFDCKASSVGLALWLHVRLNKLCTDNAAIELMDAEEWSTFTTTRYKDLPELLKRWEEIRHQKPQTTNDDHGDVPRLEWYKDAEGRGDDEEDDEDGGDGGGNNEAEKV